MTSPASRDPILHGIWPPVLLETAGNGRVDLALVKANVDHLAAAGVHGIYTADTASEFYTMEFEEWEELAVEFRAATRNRGIPAGIGCTWTNQAQALRRVARARELGFHNIHLSEPYWLPLNEKGRQTFWSEVGAVVGDALAVIVYGGSRNQLPLDGEMLLRLREYCPAIRGTKTTGFDSVATQSLLVQCPEMSHLVHETVLTASVALGAAGNPSSLAGLNARFMVSWYRLMEQKRWDEAFAIQQRVNAFYEQSATRIRKAGYVVDKALAELGGAPGITRRCRPPYAPVPDDLFELLRCTAKRYLPECLPPSGPLDQT